MSLNAETIKPLIPLIPLLPLAGATLNGLFGHRLPRAFVSLVACGTVFVSFSIAAAAAWIMWADPSTTVLSQSLYTWFESGSLSVDVTFTIDRLSGVMILVVTGVGFLIHVYSIGYMSHDPSLARYFAYLNLFTFAMLVLVLGDSLPLMFLGWEGVGLCSYLLIGFWFTDLEKAKAGKKAFVVNRIGDFGFLVAMLLCFRFFGTLSFDGLKAAMPPPEMITPEQVFLLTGIGLMFFLGATGKSAQLPLYIWLPDAMAGPTPVSALIHAATMVTAGVYMVARLGFLYSLAPIAMLTVATVGALTALFAATIGTVQNDIKKVLAYSTVSQLGFMFIAAGVGAWAIAIFHLATHAFFKACLFLGSGSVIHGMSGEQDIRQMGGLWRKMPITFWTFFAATLAITGFPLTAGFMSKDAILWNAFAADHGAFGPAFAGWAKIIWGIGVVAAGFTAFYMWRLVFLTFFSGKLRAREEVAKHVHESPFSMTLPLIVLGFLALVGGVFGIAPPIAHLWGGHGDWIVSWLAPAVGASSAPDGNHAALEWMLMGVSVGIGIAGFLIAYLLYAKKVHPFATTFATERPWRWLHARVLDKWHVDELYEATVIRPIQWGSKVLLYEGLDKRIIDGTVNLVGWFARSIGYLGQVFHTGNIQRYIAIFAIALALLLYGWLTPAAPVTGPDGEELGALQNAPQKVAVVVEQGGGR